MKIKINLLSPEKKNLLRKMRCTQIISRWEAIIILFLMIMAAVLFSINLIIKANVSSEDSSIYANSINDPNLDQINQYDSEIGATNSLVGNVLKVQNNQLFWSKMFEAINKNFQNGIKLNGLITNDYAVVITGVADTRDNLMLFKDKLGQSDCFAQVDLPLSDLVSKENVNFQINLQVKKECLK